MIPRSCDGHWSQHQNALQSVFRAKTAHLCGAGARVRIAPYEGEQDDGRHAKRQRDQKHPERIAPFTGNVVVHFQLLNYMAGTKEAVDGAVPCDVWKKDLGVGAVVLGPQSDNFNSNAVG